MQSVNPTSAVNTASNMTRGFISAMKSGKRVVRRDCAGNWNARKCCRRHRQISSALAVGPCEVDDLISIVIETGVTNSMEPTDAMLL